MSGLFSFEWIFSLQDPTRHHIDEIDEVDPEDRDSCCYLASCYDREGREEEGEHDRTRIPHDHLSRDIGSCEEERRWDDDREECEEESRILSAGRSGIERIELECESC